ncbi:hypothetical protein HYQ45_005454 [Verticillium longisporum]|uniref:Uncharacterized protein n=1 Tax=Verticillium longisporum TaxID=100787 RepID=A0A8I2ZQV9_VERLO|nr:hypothetical protein HYQ45_005454 [Verticillium longisporum]
MDDASLPALLLLYLQGPSAPPLLLPSFAPLPLPLTRNLCPPLLLTSLREVTVLNAFSYTPQLVFSRSVNPRTRPLALLAVGDFCDLPISTWSLRHDLPASTH